LAHSVVPLFIYSKKIKLILIDLIKQQLSRILKISNKI
jgi:hypothetical protein